MNSITSKADAGDNLQSSLSIKISFIVYWGMILVGLLATFVLLHGREKEIIDFYTTNANSLAYEMGEFIGTREKFCWDELEAKANELFGQYRIAGISRGADGKRPAGCRRGSPVASLHGAFPHRFNN